MHNETKISVNNRLLYASLLLKATEPQGGASDPKFFNKTGYTYRNDLALFAARSFSTRPTKLPVLGLHRPRMGHLHFHRRPTGQSRRVDAAFQIIGSPNLRGAFPNT